MSSEMDPKGNSSEIKEERTPFVFWLSEKDIKPFTADNGFSRSEWGRMFHEVRISFYPEGNAYRFECIGGLFDVRRMAKHFLQYCSNETDRNNYLDELDRWCGFR